MGADWALLLALNGWSANPIAASVASFLSSIWVPLFALLPLFGLALRRRRPLIIVAVLLVFGLADLIVSRGIKPVVDRDRPCHIEKDLHLPDGCGSGRSFPSGHATNAFALAVTAGLMWPHVSWVLVPLAFLVAGSRVVLGVHFPSDITAGALLGTLLGALVGLVALRAERRLAARAQKVAHSGS